MTIPFFVFKEILINMNNCGCNNNRIITPDCDMRRWEVECSSYLVDADNYYTKPEIDEMLDEIESAITSGCCITPEQVDEKIAEAVSGKQDTLSAGTNIVISGNVISASGCECDLSDYYTKEQVDQKIPSLSGYATEQWVLDKGYINQIKTINGISLIGTGDIEIGTGGTIDLSNYYTTAETNTRISQAVSGKQDTLIAGENIVISGNVISASGCDCDLSDYYDKNEINLIVGDMATKTWVINQNYATYSQLIQYVTNLQDQIDALRAQISGCCSDTGTTLYRWVTMTGASDYCCSGTTKMTKDQEEQSVDGGNSWTPTGNYRTGSTVIETGSTDCGYAPVSIKLHATYSTSETLDIECDGNILKQFEPQHGGSPYIGDMLTAEIGGCARMIDYTAFAPATNLRQVVIDEGVETIGQKSFSNCQKISAVTIPNSVINIDSQAFYQCSGITNLTIGSGVTYIGGNCFSGCSNIDNDLDLPNITRINNSAFAGCSKLHSVAIGSGCTRIESQVFQHCSGLTSITIYAVTPPTFGNYVFEDTNDCPIYVPAESVENYKSISNIRRYADRIQAIP